MIAEAEGDYTEKDEEAYNRIVAKNSFEENVYAIKNLLEKDDVKI